MKRGKRSPLFLGAGDEFGQICIHVCVSLCVSELQVDLLKSTNLKTVTLGLHKCNCQAACRGYLVTSSFRSASSCPWPYKQGSPRRGTLPWLLCPLPLLLCWPVWPGQEGSICYLESKSRSLGVMLSEINMDLKSTWGLP